MDDLKQLEEHLNSFDPAVRREALARLLEDHADALRPEGSNVNMHFHSFFSFNAEGWSPSRIVWESRKAGLYAAGLCDFDVLDGLEEFYGAGRAAGLRTLVSLETRVYMKPYAEVDVSSPGEPGVTYIMGAGFARVPEKGSAPFQGLEGFRKGVRDRNMALVRKINARIPRIAVDYEKDVLPLTPAGGATERHIVRAYTTQAAKVCGNQTETAKFWAEILGQPLNKAEALLDDLPALEEAVRARLVKKGGLGYEQPSENTFPPLDDFIRWVRSCDAIPMITWLDGTTAGEKDGRALLEFMKSRGCAALNIIPDRNWNIADPQKREVNRANLRQIVQVADDMGLPINVGTEMNKLGLPFVDDLDGEVLKNYRATFLRGARIMVGHCALLQYAGFSYAGEKAAAEFRTVHAKNDFFEAVGALEPITDGQAQKLEAMGPEKAYAWFQDAVKRRSTGSTKT